MPLTHTCAQVSKAWWVDPTGGILISIFILSRWFGIARSQIDKIVGRGAPRELVDQLMRVASAHHEKLEVDCLRWVWLARVRVLWHCDDNRILIGSSWFNHWA